MQCNVLEKIDGQKEQEVSPVTVEDGLGLSGGAPGGRHWAWLDIVEKVKVALD